MRLVHRLIATRADRRLANALVWLAAALLMVSGGVHLRLWDIAYRHVPTLGPLFIVQAVSAVVLAVGLAFTRRLLVVLAALGLVVGTITGFVLVLTVGLFNFKLGFISGEATFVLVVECTAVVDLVTAAALMASRATRAPGSDTVWVSAPGVAP